MARTATPAWQWTAAERSAWFPKNLGKAHRCRAGRFLWQGRPGIDRKQNHCPRVAMVRRFARPVLAGVEQWASRVAFDRTREREAPLQVRVHTPAPIRIRARLSLQVFAQSYAVEVVYAFQPRVSL